MRTVKIHLQVLSAAAQCVTPLDTASHLAKQPSHAASKETLKAPADICSVIVKQYDLMA